MSDLDTLRQIYVTEVDDDLRAENDEQIREWEAALSANEALISWQQHDTTKDIMRQARQSLTEIAVQLAQNRDLTDAWRQILWGRQDAMRWLLSLAASDPRAELERINADIKRALDATN